MSKDVWKFSKTSEFMKIEFQINQKANGLKDTKVWIDQKRTRLSR